MPAALAGRDVLGLAQTGTGKTAAFALPLLERLIAPGSPPRAPGGRRPEKPRGPRALVIAPTRELALQIRAEIQLLGRFTRVRAAVLIGGVSMGGQLDELRRGPEIVVACPGRLLDHVERGSVRLDDVEALVLDEADHMLDMGFLPDVRRILRALPARRQNLLFSATMPRELRRLADDLLHDPLVVEVAPSRPAETVRQELVRVAGEDKLPRLVSILHADDVTSAIVFLRTKHRAKRLAVQLGRLGHQAVALQGNMTQGQRTRALDGFRGGRFRVLVATDVAARGIDVPGVSHVINFDLPRTADAYTHRIGRTGRSERSGVAYTFAGPEDADALRTIERGLGRPLHPAAPTQAPARAPAAQEPRRRRAPRAPERESARSARGDARRSDASRPGTARTRRSRRRRGARREVVH